MKELILEELKKLQGLDEGWTTSIRLGGWATSKDLNRIRNRLNKIVGKKVVGVVAGELVVPVDQVSQYQDLVRFIDHYDDDSDLLDVTGISVKGHKLVYESVNKSTKLDESAKVKFLHADQNWDEETTVYWFNVDTDGVFGDYGYVESSYGFERFIDEDGNEVKNSKILSVLKRRVKIDDKLRKIASGL